MTLTVSGGPGGAFVPKIVWSHVTVVGWCWAGLEMQDNNY